MMQYFVETQDGKRLPCTEMQQETLRVAFNYEYVMRTETLSVIRKTKGRK